MFKHFKDKDGKIDKHRVYHCAIYISLGILFSIGFVFFLGSPVANNPVFCGKVCHNMNPDYQSWQNSSHGKINCRDCHISSSYFEIVKEKFFVYSIRGLTTLTNTYKRPINKNSLYGQENMPADYCERCHYNRNRKFTFSKGINMDHNKHAKYKIPCATCHNRVAHPNAEKFEPIKNDKKLKNFKYESHMEMKKGCWRCHSGSDLFTDKKTMSLIKGDVKPTSECKACHNHDFPFPEGHNRSDFRKIHGKIAIGKFDRCMKCHDVGKKFDNNGEVWCKKCHQDMAKILRKVKGNEN